MRLLYIFIKEVRLSGVRASITGVHSRKSLQMYKKLFDSDLYLEYLKVLFLIFPLLPVAGRHHSNILSVTSNNCKKVQCFYHLSITTPKKLKKRLPDNYELPLGVVTSSVHPLARISSNLSIKFTEPNGDSTLLPVNTIKNSP